jgi:hypothetical protein
MTSREAPQAEFGTLLHVSRRGRPAEALAGTGSIGLLVAYVLGVRDPELVAVIGAAVGLVPATVTTIIESGGLVGLVRRVLFGR